MSYEKSREQKTTSEENNKQELPVLGEVLISRRDALQGIAGLAGSLFFAHAPGRAQEAVSPLEHITEYERGLEELYRKAVYSDTESMAIYPHIANKTGVWDFQEVGGQSHAYIGTPESIAAKLDESDSLEIWHTHPLALVYQDPEIRERARKGEVPRFAMPPSFTDIGGAILTTGALDGARSARIAWRVADPIVVWSFTLDRGHHAFESILSVLRSVEEMMYELNEQEDVRVMVEKHHLADQSPSFRFGFLLARVKEITPASRMLVEKISAAGKKMYEDPTLKTIIDIESSRAGFPPDAPELEALREAYAKIGVALEFKIHP